MERSLNFYVNGLGFEIAYKWIDEGKLSWCWLQLGEAAVMLQEFKKQGHDSWVPDGKVGIGVSIYFICEDALEIFHEARLKGLQPETPFVENGMWVTGLSDPTVIGFSLKVLLTNPKKAFFQNNIHPIHLNQQYEKKRFYRGRDIRYGAV